MALCTVDYSFGFTSLRGLVLRIECSFTYKTADGRAILLALGMTLGNWGLCSPSRAPLSWVDSRTKKASFIWTSPMEAVSMYRPTGISRRGQSPEEMACWSRRYLAARWRRGVSALPPFLMNRTRIRKLKENSRHDG